MNEGLSVTSHNEEDFHHLTFVSTHFSFTVDSFPSYWILFS